MKSNGGRTLCRHNQIACISTASTTQRTERQNPTANEANAIYQLQNARDASHRLSSANETKWNEKRRNRFPRNSYHFVSVHLQSETCSNDGVAGELHAVKLRDEKKVIILVSRVVRSWLFDYFAQWTWSAGSIDALINQSHEELKLNWNFCAMTSVWWWAGALVGRRT